MAGYNRIIEQVSATYGSSRLAERLLADLHRCGADIQALTPADLLPFDELHIMGRQATRSLGRLIGLDPGMHVLDVGSGVGGPARTTAVSFGCRVTGVDLSEDFVEAAAMLTRRCKLDGFVQFGVADALHLPFEKQSFDAALLIHVTMNIADKATLIQEVFRVLKPGGRLALWEVCQGRQPGMIYPVPWAEDDAFSFLIGVKETAALLETGGFDVVRCRDASQDAGRWVRDRMAGREKKSSHRRQPNLDLILPDFHQKRMNVSHNLLQGCIRIVEAVATKVCPTL